MRAFAYQNVQVPGDAVMAVSGTPKAKFIAGGTNLVDLMQIGVETPGTVVDVNALPLKTIQPLPGGGVRIGALTRMSEVAEHPLLVLLRHGLAV